MLDLEADTDQLTALLFVCLFTYAVRLGLGTVLLIRVRGGSGLILGFAGAGVHPSMAPLVEAAAAVRRRRRRRPSKRRGRARV